MKQVFLTFILVIIAAAARADIQSFQAWKSTRVDDAKSVLEKLGKTTDKKTPSAQSKPLRSDQKIQQATLNLEVAQELTINDYFVLYLSQFKTREAFVEAAKKLTPEESADLMLSYQKHLTAGLDEPAVAPAKAN